MSDPGAGENRDRPHPEAQHLSTSRLFLIVVLFLVLAAYSIWNSDRFQSLFQGVSEQRLSELLQRPVRFRRVDFRILPPSLQLADISIGNDPRIPNEPLFTADELTIGGGLSVSAGQLRFGRVRAVHPRVALVQFPDGTWNLPPGLSRPAEKGGLQVRVGELIVQQGVVQFEGKVKGIDGRLEDFATEIVSLPRDRYRGTLACRKVTVGLPGAEPLVFGLELRFRLDPARGVTLERLKATGEFGALSLSGLVEDLRNPTAVLVASGDFHVAEVERVFRSKLGFSGDAHLAADLRIPPGGDFRITGRLSAPRIDAQAFRVEDIEAAVLARPGALVARFEKWRYAGGTGSGALVIDNLTGEGSRPTTLTFDLAGMSLERFFADLKLPGTGLSGAATLSASLRWAESGIDHANGGAALSIEPSRAASMVPGRFGVPTGCAGTLTVVDGRIGFEGTTFRFPASTIEATGGLRIGVWTPDFDFRIRSRDLTELDHIFQNFVAASGDKSTPLGLAGSGEVEGHIEKSWGNPDVRAQLSAESARYAGVLFGSVRGSVDMSDGAFVFHPLRVYDGDAALSLEGTARYRSDPRRPTLDLTVTARQFPAEKFLDYLDLEYPITGRITGSFPVLGNPPDGVSGGGLAALDDAQLWGQKVSRITGRVALTPGHLNFEDIRAELAGGAIGGRGSLAYREGTFEVRAAGDGVPIEAVQAVQNFSRDIAGRASFELTGSGSFRKPTLTISGALSAGKFFGHEIPAALEPRLAVRVTEGKLDATVSVPDKWSASASGDLSATPAWVDVAADARDLAALLLFTPAQIPPGDGGAVAARGRLRLPAAPGERPAGDFIVTEARLDARNHPGLLRTSGDVHLRIADGRITADQFQAVGDGVDLSLRGAFDTSGEKPGMEAHVSGVADAAVLALAVPDLGLTGKLAVDMEASGPLDTPTLAGSVRIENGHYRFAGYSFDSIEGALRLAGSGGEIEGLRAKVGDGDAFVAGNFRLDGRSLKDFRFSIQGRRIQVRAVPSLRLTIDADLVASGNASGNDLRGEVTLLRGTYSKDMEVTISDLLAPSRPGGSLSAFEPWKERTTLEVRIVSAASLEVRNNLARLSGTVDLMARGTIADPILLGQILLDEGGRVVFSDIRYEIEAGTITFSNTTQIAPFIDLRARAEVKGYDLVVTLTGTWPRVLANFTSNPPLSNDSILALVLSGSPPDTRNPTVTSDQLVSAAGGVISGAVTGGFTRQTQRLFKLDRFQIDPVFTGSQVTTVRSTIGKQITQDLSVTSSIALDSSKQPIIRVEWQATNTILVQLTRDENGIYAITFRRRQRL